MEENINATAAPAEQSAASAPNNGVKEGKKIRKKNSQKKSMRFLPV